MRGFKEKTDGEGLVGVDGPTGGDTGDLDVGAGRNGTRHQSESRMDTWFR